MRFMLAALAASLSIVPSAVAASSSATTYPGPGSSSAPRAHPSPAIAARHVSPASSPAVTWLQAVSIVGRYFGRDLSAWERACSQTGSEGGWGRWVWNGGRPVDNPERLRLIAAGAVPSRPYGSSGAGGWLQFLRSTFESVIDRGIVEARRRGMVVPASARSWLSPVGQAIAGAQMIRAGRRGEWSGWAC